MRLAILKRSGVAGVTSVILAGVLAVGLAQNASAQANPPNAEARTLEGTWWVQVTALTDCVSHVPLMSFTALLTFAKGGTMTGTTTNPAFAIGIIVKFIHDDFLHIGLRTFPQSNIGKDLGRAADNRCVAVDRGISRAQAHILRAEFPAQ